MRLIDADDAINIFTNRLFETLKTNLPCVTATENQICLDTCYKVAKHEIDNIPTSFSIDNILEKLEELKKDNTNGCEKVNQELCNSYLDCGLCLIDRIINIVKQELNKEN